MMLEDLFDIHNTYSSNYLVSDDKNDNHTLKIERSLKVVKGVIDEKKPKTNSSIRMILLSNSTINILKQYKEWQDDYINKLGKKWKGTNRIFTSINGTHMNPATCYKIFTKITKKYDLEHIRFHDLRHIHLQVYLFIKELI